MRKSSNVGAAACRKRRDRSVLHDYETVQDMHRCVIC